MMNEVRARPRRDHDRSLKLEPHENDRLIALIQDSNGLSMAMSIIQMYRTVSSNDQSWSKFEAGVICLVKDYSRKAYFFRLFTLKPNLIWEEQLDKDIDFKKSTDHFFYYSSPQTNSLIGFNFSCTNEAFKFHRGVIRAVNSIYRLEYKQQSQVDSNNNNCIPSYQTSLINKDESSVCQDVSLQDSFLKRSEVSSVSTTSNTSFKKQFQSVGKFIKMRLTRKTSSVAAKKSTSFSGSVVNKSDISDPKDFVHVNHIGLSTGDNRGLDVQVGEDGKDIDLIVKILKHLNIKPNHKSVQYAKDFMQSHGGWEKYYDEVLQQQVKQSMVRSKTIDCNLKESPIIDFKNPVTPTFTITTANSSSSNDSNNSSTPMVARVYSDGDHHLDLPISPPPRRITSAHKPPPPLPPTNLLSENGTVQLESTNLINSPNLPPTNLSFISPIAPNRQLDDEVSPSVSNVSSSTSAMLSPTSCNSFSILDESKRSALLKSIENFQGGLKHVETAERSLLSCGSPNASIRFSELSINQNSSQNKLMNQLVQALAEIRPYINYYSDSDSDQSSFSSEEFY